MAVYNALGNKLTVLPADLLFIYKLGDKIQLSFIVIKLALNTTI